LRYHPPPLSVMSKVFQDKKIIFIFVTFLKKDNQGRNNNLLTYSYILK